MAGSCEQPGNTFKAWNDNTLMMSSHGLRCSCCAALRCRFLNPRTHPMPAGIACFLFMVNSTLSMEA